MLDGHFARKNKGRSLPDSDQKDGRRAGMKNPARDTKKKDQNLSSLPPPPEEMNHPDAKPYGGNGYQNLEFVFFQIPHERLQSAAEKVTPCPDRKSPEQCSKDIEEDESSVGNGAGPNHKRRNRSEPPHETVDEDQRSLKSLQEFMGPVDPILPGREPGQNSAAIFSA